jgi:CRISPR-associated protein Cst2
MVATSDAGPLPFPVSPIYPGYVAKYEGIIPDTGRLHVFGVVDVPGGVTTHKSIGDLFDAVTG